MNLPECFSVSFKDLVVPSVDVTICSSQLTVQGKEKGARCSGSSESHLPHLSPAEVHSCSSLSWIIGTAFGWRWTTAFTFSHLASHLFPVVSSLPLWDEDSTGAPSPGALLVSSLSLSLCSLQLSTLLFWQLIKCLFVSLSGVPEIKYSLHSEA